MTQTAASRYLPTPAADVRTGDVIKFRRRLANGRLDRQALTYQVTSVQVAGGYAGITTLLGGYRRFSATDLIDVQVPH
jgi:hypothetical protein